MSVTVKENVESLLAGEAVTSGLWKGVPRWFSEMQKSAEEKFRATRMPQRTDEAWRFADLKKLDFVANCVPAQPLPTGDTARIAEASRGPKESGAELVFANEELVRRVFMEGGGAVGVICAPLREAVEAHGDLMQEYFMAQEAQLGSAKFALWHQAKTRSGVFVYVPPGMEVALPIRVSHWLGGANASIFPHTLVVTGENARVTVVESLRSHGDSAGLSCGVVDLIAGAGSKIRYVTAQVLNKASSALQIASAVVSRDADVRSYQINLGGAWARSEYVSHMAEKGAHSEMLSISIAEGNQVFDQRTLQHHSEPGTTSDLLYKNALYDKAKTIFAGLIRVDPGAHRTDAYQTCRNLLMSDDAEASAMPGLEIEADQVKCSHGATSGRISDDEIFYFNARGVPTHVARQMITFGFTREVIERIGDEAIEEMVSGWIENKFRQLSH